MTGRVCRTCRVAQPLTNFWKQKARRDGLQSECKSCMKNRTTAYHRDNRDALRPRNNAVKTAKRLREPVEAFVASVRHRAKKLGRECTITSADLVFPEVCPVLGIPLSFGIGRGLGMALDQRDNRYSVDRIDNSKGYVPGNVAVVSYRANRIKSDATADELLKIARFYAELGSNEGGALHVPGVQSNPQEEEGQVPPCQQN